MSIEDRNLDMPISARSTQVPQLTQPMVQKGKHFSSITHSSMVLTRGSVFILSTKKQAINTGVTQVAKSSYMNLQTIKPFRSSCFYHRTSDIRNHKCGIKGWKRYEVKAIRVTSSRSSGFNWKLEIKDMDGTRTILDQLKNLH